MDIRLRPTTLRSSLRDTEDGASAVEYGLLAVAIAAVIAAIVFVLGGVVRGDFSTACTNVGTSAGASTTSCH